MLPRQKSVLEFWDRSKELTIKNKEYKDFTHKLFLLLLESDIKNGDLTSDAIIKNGKSISAVIVAKENGLLAGLEEFKSLNSDLKLKFLKKDGDRIKNKEIIAEIRGNAIKILERERTNLNLLQRMSGIATLVDSLNKKIESKVKIAATRKTLWGLLDKKAVSIGHGLTHRLSLSDCIIIKDNHLKIAGYDFGKAISSAKAKSRFIEIEVEDKRQALKAAAAIKNATNKHNKNLFALMLDKISPDSIIQIISELKKLGLYDYVLLEASGGINSKNIMGYADCGADVISAGFITNSAKVLDMSQEIV